ncbi:MAG TPA: tetratricopeptide repeat protein, partial [Pyrinomonadaceae bacterium]
LVATRPDVKRSPVLMLRLMPAQRAGGPEVVRDFSLGALKKSDLTKERDVRTSAYGQVPVARYTQAIQLVPTVTLFEGMKCAEGYFVRDGFWVTVKLMSQSFGDKEESLFHSVLDSVRFADTTRPADSFDYFHKGRAAYRAADYVRAVGHYRAAFELERKGRRLPPDSWRALVEQLANAYGALSDYASAKEVLEYGLANDPTHFWFNYNLARVYAAAGDADNAVAYLEKAALVHKQADRRRFSLGGPPPDPSKDAVFARLKETDKFRKAAKALR